MKHKPKPKYLEAEHGGQRERWLISYTDFVTILLILFIAIAAQGIHSVQPPLRPPQPQPNPQRVKAAPVGVAPVGVAPVEVGPVEVAPVEVGPVEAAPKPQPAESSHQALVRADEKLRLQGLDSRLEKRGLVISLPQAILFPSGEDHVMATALPIVSQIADVLNSVPNKVALVGHADSIPIHNKRFQSNWELSAARSVNLLEVLSTRYGISESRLSVQSYGSNDPKNSNDTEAGRAENRRVEILLLDETAQ
jgi:chemotaxis protein MotB